MRNFINIIASQENDPEILLENTELLLEGRQYRDMLAGMEALAERYPDVRELVRNDIVEISRVCDGLKRKDRQVWAARLLRLEALSALLKAKRARDNPEFIADASQLITKYNNDFIKITGHSFLVGQTHLLDDISRVIVNHFMGIPYAPIQKYIFQPGRSFTEVVADLTHLEDDFKELSDGLVREQPGDTILINFPNGFCWMLLPRSSCDEEGEAMGHCGNSAGASYGDRILSLRQYAHTFDGQKYYHAYLTFILRSDGRLGEMKGRGNDKPVARYHTYIVSLLKNDIVKGIVGGGYKPQNNFSLDDLPENEAKELIHTKPNLGTINQQIAILGDTPEVRDNALAILKGEFGDKTHINDEGLFVIREWNDVPALVNDLCDNQWWHKVVNDSNDAFSEWNHDGGDDSNWASLLDDLPVREQVAIALYAQNLIEDNGDEDEVDDFDMSRAGEVINALVKYGNGEEDVFSAAVSDGLRYGAEEDAFKALYRGIKDAEQSINFGSLEVPETDKGDPVWDSKSAIVLSLSEVSALQDRLLKTVEEREYKNPISVIKTIFWDGESPIDPTEPHYGFSGWDVKVAIEYVRDNLDIEGFDEVLKEPVEPLPDFTSMSPMQIREWIKNMYARIPDGFIHKAAVDELPETRLPDVAKGLWIKYYGKTK